MVDFSVECPGSGEASFEAVIVLGAKLRPDGAPSPALERRVARAVDLVRAGRATHLLMSGGAVSHCRPEAEAMRALALSQGIPSERIVIEDHSRNTVENARLSAEIVAFRGWRRLALVTDSYHMPRALYVFRRLGLSVTGFAARPTNGAGARWWLAWLREAAALPKTVVRVEIKRLGG